MEPTIELIARTNGRLLPKNLDTDHARCERRGLRPLARCTRPNKPGSGRPRLSRRSCVSNCPLRSTHAVFKRLTLNVVLHRVHAIESDHPSVSKVAVMRKATQPSGTGEAEAELVLNALLKHAKLNRFAGAPERRLNNRCLEPEPRSRCTFQLSDIYPLKLA